MSSARSSEPAALERSGFTARLGELSGASDGLWLLGTVTGLAFTLVAAVFFPYPASPSGKFWAYAGLFIRAACYLMFLAVLPIAARAIANEERPVAAAMAGGARFATAIAAGYVLAYALLEGWGR